MKNNYLKPVVFLEDLVYSHTYVHVDTLKGTDCKTDIKMQIFGACKAQNFTSEYSTNPQYYTHAYKAVMAIEIQGTNSLLFNIY